MRSNLTQKLVLSYGSRIAMQIIQVGASIVVARVAGPTVLGTVAFGLAFVSVFEFIADLGIGSAHMKLISEGHEIGKCISTYSIMKLFNTFLFFVTVLAFFFVQKYAFHIQFESSAHEQVVIIMLITVTINQLLFIPRITFAARTEQAKESIPEFIRTMIYQILRVVIVLLGYRAVALAFGDLISTLAIVPLVFYLFKDYPRDKFDVQLAKKYLKISLPLLVVAMSTTVIQYIDKIALQYFANSEQVGFYTAGYRIGSLVVIIATSAGQLFFPLFSNAASDGKFTYIQSTIEKFERFSFLFIMPMILFLSLYSDVIIHTLLGSQYNQSVPIMNIINVAMFLMVLNMPYGNVLTGMGYFRLTAVLHLMNLLLFVCLMLVLANPYLLNLGAVGIATAVFVSNVFIGILNRIYAKKKCPVINLLKSLKFVLFGIISYFAFYFLYNHFGRSYGSTFKVSFIFIYFVTTYAALVLLGWIKRSDVLYLKQVTDIRKMGRYIKGEMNT